MSCASPGFARGSTAAPGKCADQMDRPGQSARSGHDRLSCDLPPLVTGSSDRAPLPHHDAKRTRWFWRQAKGIALVAAWDSVSGPHHTLRKPSKRHGAMPDRIRFHYVTKQPRTFQQGVVPLYLDEAGLWRARSSILFAELLRHGVRRIDAQRRRGLLRQRCGQRAAGGSRPGQRCVGRAETVLEMLQGRFLDECPAVGLGALTIADKW